ncbi:MAG: sugar phosphate nucleotidyltransferase [Nitrososphaeraceae archaeon]|nr:sugar phosphate nucleotidyltransferase [Nitrososphaeraceae archaeon]
MKVLLIAGGSGSRAKPFSQYTPKPMISLDGRPIIDHMVRYLARFPEIDNFVIVCEFDEHGKQIINYFEGKERIVGKQIVFVEDKKNGTGGAILNAETEIGNDESFIVWFADNMCALDMDSFVKQYKFLNESQKKSGKNMIGMVVTRDYRREETGRIVCDPNETNRIMEFTEKPFTKLDLPETLGIYIFSNTLFSIIRNQRDSSIIGNSIDLSFDILAKLPSLGFGLYSYPISSHIDWIDVESPVYAERNKELVKRILAQMKVIK